MSKSNFKHKIAAVTLGTMIATASLSSVASAEEQIDKNKKVNFAQSIIMQQISNKLGINFDDANIVTPFGSLKISLNSNNFTIDLSGKKIAVAAPTKEPVATPAPTKAPVATPAPTKAPVATPAPTKAPVSTPAPTKAPVATPAPTKEPVATPAPTKAPVATPAPTKAPVATPAPTKEPVATPAPTAGVTNDVAQKQSQVLALVNKERAAAGLTALTLDASLTEVAMEKARDMAQNNYFSHQSPTYGSPFDMLRSANISYKTAGENIAYGQTTPEQVMNDWMNSQGHRANILNANYTKLGVGFVDGKWVQLFIG